MMKLLCLVQDSNNDLLTKASLLWNKSQNFAVNIFEVTKFSTKHIFDEVSCFEADFSIGIALLNSCNVTY